MDRKTFIQNMVIRIGYVQKDGNDVIQHAENCWEELNRRGYGSVRSSGSNEKVDYYKRLGSGQTKKDFDVFWSAWGKHGSRNRAAKSWIELDLSDDDKRKAIKGASKEAGVRGSRTTTAPFAERWLNDRRFENEDVTEADRKSDSTEVLELMSRLKHAKSMALSLSKAGDDSSVWDDEVMQIERKITQYRGE